MDVAPTESDAGVEVEFDAVVSGEGESMGREGELAGVG